MVRMMEVFARYLSNAWRRLEIMSEFQQMREREMSLDRRELAEKLLSVQLSGAPGTNLDALQTLVHNVGFERFPDHVLLLRLQDPVEQAAAAMPGAAEAMPAQDIGNQLSLLRVAHMVEDRCRNWPNTLATLVVPGEMCIFTSQRPRGTNTERLLLEEMAQILLRTVRSQGLMSARIGISGPHQQPTELLRAYHEAASAVDSGHSTVNWFEATAERRQPPAQALVRVLKALQGTEPFAVSAALREFLAATATGAATVAQLEQARGLLTWACEHLSREIAALGVHAVTVDAARENTIQIIMGSPSSFAMAEAFRAFVEQLRQHIAHLFSQREQKIVSETQRLVRELGPDKVTVHSLARDLKLSAGHLGRVYSRTAGHTLEDFLIRQKLEMGKRLLLDPRLQVAEVAERCGFCNPAYFASVFKKYMHCTPRAYASQPQRWGAFVPEAREPSPATV
jgi:AraC-like DNA-binding protein